MKSYSIVVIILIANNCVVKLENKSVRDKNGIIEFVYNKVSPSVGLDRTVVSISHCGCDDPGSIPGLDNLTTNFAARKFCVEIGDTAIANQTHET